MKRWLVIDRYLAEDRVEVEANTRAEAIEKAWDAISDGDSQPDVVQHYKPIIRRLPTSK